MATKQIPEPGTGPFIILSGPPGAGKSTVAQTLKELFPEVPAYIEGDTFWQFFPGGPKAVRQVGDFRTCMRSMLVAAVPYALSGYTTIVDFSIPPWYLKGVAKILHGRAAVHYVVLLPTEAVSSKRARERERGPIADYDHEFYESFKESPVRILAGDDNPAETAREVYAGLQTNDFLLGF